MGAATRNEINDWFDAGVAKDATHMAVFCDTYDHDDYPVYITATDGFDARRQVTAHLTSMQKLMEVYHLGSDKAVQMGEHRAQHYDPLVPPLSLAEIHQRMNLRLAYPLGYLPMRGVRTLGKWVCLFDGDPYPERQSDWLNYGNETLASQKCAYQPAFDKMKEPIIRGDLLPHLDPMADPATWACAKLDLARGVFGVERASTALSFGWHRWDTDGGIWALFAIMPSDKTEGMAYTFEIDTANAVEALIGACIEVRMDSHLPMDPDAIRLTRQQISERVTDPWEDGHCYSCQGENPNHNEGCEHVYVHGNGS